MQLYPNDTNIKPFLEYLIKNLKDESIGVEIGVAQGFHSMGILDNLPNLKTLYLIDPYINNKFLNEFTKNILENNEYNKKVKFIRKMSYHAIKDIPENIDFIYIDGNHSYRIVKNDIEMYHKKVKIGGIFGGDDYIKNTEKEKVKLAVDEFISKYNYELITGDYYSFTRKNTDGYSKNVDWWVIKK